MNSSFKRTFNKGFFNKSFFNSKLQFSFSNSYLNNRSMFMIYFSNMSCYNYIINMTNTFNIDYSIKNNQINHLTLSNEVDLDSTQNISNEFIILLKDLLLLRNSRDLNLCSRLHLSLSVCTIHAEN